MRYIKKHWLHILLLIALFTSFTIPALADMPVIQPAVAGAGLWEVDGTETQLITADEIDMQTKKIINLVDPAANQDAATKKYVDDAIDTDIATHSGLDTGVHGAGGDTLATDADIATHAALDTGVHGAGGDTLATDADIATHAALTATHGVSGTILGTEDVDDTPVDAATTDPVSSNWAYDHENDGGVHTTTTTESISLYVDGASGNDEDAGTSGSPKATIQGALDALPVVIAHACIIYVRGPQSYAEGDAYLEFSRFDCLSSISIRAVNESDELMYDNGQADAGGANNELEDGTKSWSADQFNGAYVWIYEGTGVGQIREIADTTATTLTTTVNWVTNPDATSYYAVGGGVTMSGAGTYHVVVNGLKTVNVYGFKHTGATAYDMRWSTAAAGICEWNYFTGARGLSLYNTGVCSAFYNYFDVTSTPTIYLNIQFGGTIRGNVLYGAANQVGVLSERMSLALMTGIAGLKNYISDYSGSGYGVKTATGGGCEGASSQVYNNCGTSYGAADATAWVT